MELTRDEQKEAILRAIPQPPIKNELGGGIYYTCHWMKCNETLKRWYNYCPVCGTKIDWQGEEE